MIQSESPQKFAAQEQLALRVIVDLIAEALHGSGQITDCAKSATRAQKNKIRGRIRYAEKTGRLSRLSSEGGEPIFLLGEVITWARNKWPGMLLDLPAEESVDVSSIGCASDRTTVAAIPATYARSTSVIREHEATIEQLRAELSTEREENAALRPQVEKQRQRTEQRKRDGGEKRDQ